MQALQGTWIRIGANDDLINLNYVSKILKIDAAGPVYRIVIFQGVGGTGTTASTQSYSYGASAPNRDAAFNSIFTALRNIGPVTDIVV